MKQVTVVTGPLRSGTSCITGLLECCGFDLGRNVRVLRKVCGQNPKGHFELDLLFTINQRLIIEGSHGIGDILNVCDQQSLAFVATQRERYFRLFLDKFDGDLCKDPLFCLTLPFWKTHWPAQKKTIFCLRHPYTVSQSMMQRYAVSEQQALNTWRVYAERFFHYNDQQDVFIIDFDSFALAPLSIFSTLLAWLEKSVSTVDLQNYIDDFFCRGYVHWDAREVELTDLYQDILPFYLDIKQRAAQLQS